MKGNNDIISDWNHLDENLLQNNPILVYVNWASVTYYVRVGGWKIKHQLKYRYVWYQ